MTWVWIVLAIVLVVLIGLGLWELGRRRRRTERLREHFGHEYDAAVAATGSRKRGEEELEAREERRQELDIRPLPDQARRRYRDRWRGVQERFVDAPSEAVAEADGLIGE